MRLFDIKTVEVALGEIENQITLLFLSQRTSEQFRRCRVKPDFTSKGYEKDHREEWPARRHTSHYR